MLLSRIGFAFLAAATMATMFISPSEAKADCGQILVVTRVHVTTRVIATTYRPPAPPYVVNTGPTSVISNNTNNNINNINNAAAFSGNDPEWDAVAQRKAFGKSIRTFEEPRQRSVVAWNGREQILVLKTEQKAFKGNGSALSILPLPGKPIAIKEGDDELFTNCFAAVGKKLGQFKKPVVLTSTIGAHNIFVVHAKTTDDFVREVEEYVDNKFGSDARPLITGHIRDIIDRYVKDNFEYFAFDLVMSGPTLLPKQTIHYQFESDYLYYPMYISRAGGSGDTSVQLVVFSNDELGQVRKGALPEKFIKSTKGVSFTNSELDKLNPELAELMSGSGAVGRVWTIKGKLDGFPGDIMMKP